MDSKAGHSGGEEKEIPSLLLPGVETPVI